MENLTIRPMAASEISLALDWAAAEGWNPGLEDADCFATVDPQGFWVGELGGESVATISVVNYDDRFAFLGCYIVRPDRRGQGLGWQLWQAAIAHAGSRTIGLDGVLEQQDNYRRSGFMMAHRHIRYGGVVKPAAAAPTPPMVDLGAVPLDLIVAADRRVFPAARPDFLQAWITAPGHRSRGCLRGENLAGWGVIRPCRRGYKVGPLIARDPAIARAIFTDLTADLGDQEVFLDVPKPHGAAVELALQQGLQPVFETARMYRGPNPSIALELIFGVTTFELG
jgi:GNAT superfamily N-acetyltransferase